MMELFKFNATLPDPGDLFEAVFWEDPFSQPVLWQAACVVGLVCLITPLLRIFRKCAVQRLNGTAGGRFSRFAGELCISMVPSFLYFSAFLICGEVFRRYGYRYGLLVGARDLAGAWLLVRLLFGLLPNKFSARLVSAAVIALVVMNLAGILQPVLNILDGASLLLGDTRFTVLGVAKGVLLGIILLQGASVGTRFFQDYMDHSQKLSPSIKVLFVKIVKIFLFTVALFISVSSIGVDLTHLAVFSGALGVGIGFGLKTIFSNLVSGVILLSDESIKPGDVISVGDVFGQVMGMHSRYVSVLTRDGVEYLIPNEQLFAGQVVNWTHSDPNVRLKIPIGVDYGTDLQKAMLLMEQAASETLRVLQRPQPGSRLIGFGDNSVNLELRIWIRDAEKGVTGVKSAVLLRIWQLFNEYDIRFPFPQRDLHITPESRINVVVDRGKAEQPKVAQGNISPGMSEH